MARFIYNAELKLDRHHILKCTVKRRLETRSFSPKESTKVNARHYAGGSFYESGDLTLLAMAMAQQIYESLPVAKLPAGILIEQDFVPELKYILIKAESGYQFIIKR